MSELPARMAAPTLPSLTSLRAFAALAVVVHHMSDRWPHVWIVRKFGEIGWLGVSFFFILSGFVLMWGYDAKGDDRRFVLRRLIRIYPLHLACLIVALAIFLRFGDPGAGYVGNAFGTALNVLLLHGWVPGHPEIRQAWNGVSWTLSCELFFYLAAPMAFRALLRLDRLSGCAWVAFALWALPTAAAVTATLAKADETLDFLFYHPLPLFAQFMLGACGALMLRRGWRPPRPAVALAFLVAPILVYLAAANGKFVGAVLLQTFVPGAFLTILAFARRDSEGRASWLRSPRLVELGEASFALYMSHALLLGLYAPQVRSIVERFAIGPALAEVFTVLGLVLMTRAALALHRDFEQPVRRLLLARLANGESVATFTAPAAQAP